MAKAKKNRIDTSPTPQTPLGTLGSLFQNAGFQPSGADKAPQPPETSPSPDANIYDLLRQEKKLRVHTERKGRKGKTVTIIHGFQMNPTALKEIARAMAKAMGCGSSVEPFDEATNEMQIVLQGDNSRRVQKWLSDAATLTSQK